MPTTTTLPGNDGVKADTGAFAPKPSEAQFLRGLQNLPTTLSREQRTELNQRVSTAAQAARNRVENSQIIPALNILQTTYAEIRRMGGPLLERSAGERLIQATNSAIAKARQVMSASELEKTEKLLLQLEKASRNLV